MNDKQLLLKLTRNAVVLLAGLGICALLVYWISLPSEPTYVSDGYGPNFGAGIVMLIIGTGSVLITVITWSLWILKLSFKTIDKRYQFYNTYLILLPYVIVVLLFLSVLR